MRKKAKKYEKSLIKSLKNPVEAAAYLTAHLEDCDEYSEKAFLLALRDVSKAYGKSSIAKRAKLGKEILDKTLSGSTQPKLDTLKRVLNSMELKMTVEPKKPKAV